jgi:hypothetical protein
MTYHETDNWSSYGAAGRLGNHRSTSAFGAGPNSYGDGTTSAISPLSSSRRGTLVLMNDEAGQNSPDSGTLTDKHWWGSATKASQKNDPLPFIETNKQDSDQAGGLETLNRDFDFETHEQDSDNLVPLPAIDMPMPLINRMDAAAVMTDNENDGDMDGDLDLDGDMDLDLDLDGFQPGNECDDSLGFDVNQFVHDLCQVEDVSEDNHEGVDWDDLDERPLAVILREKDVALGTMNKEFNEDNHEGVDRDDQDERPPPAILRENDVALGTMNKDFTEDNHEGVNRDELDERPPPVILGKKDVAPGKMNKEFIELLRQYVYQFLMFPEHRAKICKKIYSIMLEIKMHLWGKDAVGRLFRLSEELACRKVSVPSAALSCYPVELQPMYLSYTLACRVVFLCLFHAARSLSDSTGNVEMTKNTTSIRLITLIQNQSRKRHGTKKPRS